jgi:putative ABC transport system ATP-binding protein
LRGIDLNIQQGEMVAVWGPSGSGKSTLMNTIGLIDRPDRGEVQFDGVDVLGLQDNALSDYRGRKVGFVFQSFNLLPVLNVLENVMLPLQLQGTAMRPRGGARPNCSLESASGAISCSGPTG